jgi:D-ribulokinase
MTSIAIGIDLATANARVLALDVDTGAICAQSSAPLPAPVRGSGGESTQAPEYWSIVRDLLRSVTRALGARRNDIDAISATGTSGSVVPADLQNRPLGHAALYDDNRGASLRSVVESVGVEWATGSQLARIADLAERSPAARYISTVDVVLSALAGAALPSDVSHFLKAGIDVGECRWNADALRAVGLTTQLLPVLVPSGTVIGQVSRDAAELTGVPAGTAIVSGMTDGCTAQIAAGGVRDGDTIGVLGTTLVLKAVSPTPVTSPVVYSHRAPDGLWWPGGASNSGAGAIGPTFRDAGRDLEDWGRDAVAGGPSSVVGYPLSGAGERFPFTDPKATSFFSAAPASRVEEYRTLLEGVAFVERLGLETLEAAGVVGRRHLAAGGASASPSWVRIRATVLRRPISVAGSEASSLGAAILAGASISDVGFADTVARLTRVAAVVDPDEREIGRLDDSFARFRAELQQRGYLPSG